MPENTTTQLDLLLERIGTALFNIRKQRREKETSVASSVGISHAVISRIENAKYRRLTLELLLKITQYYKVGIEELLPADNSGYESFTTREALIEQLLKENTQLREKLRKI